MFFQRTWVSFPALHDGSQLFLKPVPRDWVPPFGLWGFCIHAVHRQICRQNSYTSKVNGSQKMKRKGYESVSYHWGVDNYSAFVAAMTGTKQS